MTNPRSRAASLLSLAALAAATMAVGCGDRTSTTVSVPAGQTWTDTRIAIRAGQHVTITASGKVEAKPRLACGPGGFTDQPQWKIYSVIPAVPHLALIGKVGAEGAPFAVGEHLEATADRDGALFLGVNDKDAANNRGGYEATITVR